MDKCSCSSHKPVIWKEKLGPHLNLSPFFFFLLSELKDFWNWCRHDGHTYLPHSSPHPELQHKAEPSMVQLPHVMLGELFIITELVEHRAHSNSPEPECSVRCGFPAPRLIYSPVSSPNTEPLAHPRGMSLLCLLWALILTVKQDKLTLLAD